MLDSEQAVNNCIPPNTLIYPRFTPNHQRAMKLDHIGPSLNYFYGMLLWCSLILNGNKQSFETQECKDAEFCCISVFLVRICGRDFFQILVPRRARLSEATDSDLDTDRLPFCFVCEVRSNLGFTVNHFGEFRVCFFLYNSFT